MDTGRCTAAEWTDDMTSTFGIFESAKSGLSVAMQQLNVTEQNIANVNTAGYTRQRLLTSAKEPPISKYLIAPLSKTAVGQGVEATGIQQIRSEYLDQQYRTLNSGYSYYVKRTESLEYLTGLYNEHIDASSLTTSIKNFFSALNTFSQDTSSKEYRTNVQQQALGITQNFNNVYEEMQSLWQEQNDSINTVTQKINSIAQKIAQLNDAIAGSVQTGGVANDLNDERNLLLDELSGCVNITYNWNAKNDSMVDVKIGGVTLVEGKTTNEIAVGSAADNAEQINELLVDIADVNQEVSSYTEKETEIRDLINSITPPDLANFLSANIVLQPSADDANLVDVKFGNVIIVNGTDTTPVPIEQSVTTDLDAWIAFNRKNLILDGSELSIESGDITGGQLYSNMEMISNKSAKSPGIPYYMDQINTLVREMAKNLNAIHRKGYRYPGGTTSELQNIDFFKVPDGTDPEAAYSKITAGNFTLSDEVLASVYNIAGSSEQVSLGDDSPQSGNNKIALELFNDLVNSNYNDKLNSIVVSLGIDANTSGSVMNTKQSLLGSVDMQRSSLSSVSLDEETTNLIIFQQAYNASARIITTIDEMLNTMINNMGIVGR
ncbi:MAG: flagellar hook-associated protein FlgK [Clostridiales bacterium]|nr:flagellar hook-associated protein FlgK [Clostridiales bacterium]